MFPNLKEDLKTYDGDWGAQGFWVMIIYRFGRWRYTLQNPWLRKPFSFLYKFLYKIIQIVTGIEFPCEGAKILGDITVGDNVVIGANAVVIRDVPPDSVAVGIPARVIQKDGNQETE
ncbi:MAG: hypothetical protein B6240_13400 [Desulfobacteraceae bacterium 4572_87]|nr:MAG: hypothetical protein B6240_13400 [Desulfobacteraceae bacterium 4572_87]